MGKSGWHKVDWSLDNPRLFGGEKRGSEPSDEDLRRGAIRRRIERLEEARRLRRDVEDVFDE